MTQMMRKMKPIIVWSILGLEMLIGLTFVTKGVTYKEVDTIRADEMLSFIRDNNPTYFDMLNDQSMPEYREEFYEYYTKKGNDVKFSSGMLFMVMAVNAALILMVMKNGEADEEPVDSMEDLVEAIENVEPAKEPEKAPEPPPPPEATIIQPR